ncbi:hypothetical protein T261_8061 [Streptomyces lydicus]|nr:hypothetical protein T261_8061 [Streptomyces lydicus]
MDHLIVGPGVPVPSTDVQWARIEPLLPDRTPRRGGRWRDHRVVMDAIAWKFRTGPQWGPLPEKTIYLAGLHVAGIFLWSAR